MKVVINKCHGGFGLSDQGIEHYVKLKGLELVRRDSQFAFSESYDYYYPDSDKLFLSRYIGRDDPALVQTVEDIGKKANGRYASLKVVDVPDDVEWEIDEYDGLEWVAEKHRTWS
jgi:hypothetical protein